MKKMPLGWMVTVIVAIFIPTITVIFASGRLAEKIDRIEDLNNGRYAQLDADKVDQEVFEIQMANIQRTQIRILDKLDNIHARIK